MPREGKAMTSVLAVYQRDIWEPRRLLWLRNHVLGGGAGSGQRVCTPGAGTCYTGLVRIAIANTLPFAHTWHLKIAWKYLQVALDAWIMCPEEMQATVRESADLGQWLLNRVYKPASAAAGHEHHHSTIIEQSLPLATPG